MYSDVVQRTLVYLKQLILKQGFLFSFFFFFVPGMIEQLKLSALQPWLVRALS